MTGVDYVKVRYGGHCGKCKREIAKGEIALSWSSYMGSYGSGYICKDCICEDAKKKH